MTVSTEGVIICVCYTL